jgi:hypothetical protein
MLLAPNGASTVELTATIDRLKKTLLRASDGQIRIEPGGHDSDMSF